MGREGERVGDEERLRDREGGEGSFGDDFCRKLGFEAFLQEKDGRKGSIGDGTKEEQQ